MSLPTAPEMQDARSLCAIFDFVTHELDSQFLCESEMIERQRESINETVTNMALEEYNNIKTNNTITLIILSCKDIKRLKKTTLPCLNKTASIQLKMSKERDCYYVDISTSNRCKTLNNNNSDNYKIRCSLNGMVFAIIFKTFPPSKRYIVSGVYYHGHNANVYTPKRLPFDDKHKHIHHGFIRDNQSSIPSISSHIRAKKQNQEKSNKNDNIKRRQKRKSMIITKNTKTNKEILRQRKQNKKQRKSMIIRGSDVFKKNMDEGEQNKHRKSLVLKKNKKNKDNQGIKRKYKDIKQNKERKRKSLPIRRNRKYKQQNKENVNKRQKKNQLKSKRMSRKKRKSFKVQKKRNKTNINMDDDEDFDLKMRSRSVPRLSLISLSSSKLKPLTEGAE